MNTGTGIFFDGRTSARHVARRTLGEAGLVVEGDGGGTLQAQRCYDDIEELTAPAGLLRLGRRDQTTLERLEIVDAGFAAAIDLCAIHIDRAGALQRGQHRGVIVWTVAATTSPLAVAYFGVPALADRLVPTLAARKLTDAADVQVRARLAGHHLGARFVCGSTTPKERAGRAALDEVMHRRSGAAHLLLPIVATVVRRPEANVITLPGAQIYVFKGLIKAAVTPDELPGEIGHVVHHEGTKSVPQADELSLLLACRSGLHQRRRHDGGGEDGAEVVLFAPAGDDGRYLWRRTDEQGRRQRLRACYHAGHNRRYGTSRRPGCCATIPTSRCALPGSRGSRPASPRPFLDAVEWAALRNICAR